MLKATVGCLALVTLLTACQSVKKEYRAVVPDRDTMYTKEVVSPPLKMPQGLALQHHDDFYPIPSGKLPEPGTEPPDITPPGIDNIPTPENPS